MVMKKGTVTILKWAGIAIVLIGVLYVVLLVSANYKLRRAYAALEEAGRPMKVIPPTLPYDPAGLPEITRSKRIVLTKVPDKDNAALLYQAAVLRLKSETGRNKEKSLFDQLNPIGYKILTENSPATQTDWDTFRTLIAHPVFANALELWENGLEKPYCQYERDYNAGPDMRYTGVTEHRFLFQTFGVAALIKAQDGDSEGAWRLIEKLFRFADSLKTEPTLIDQLFRMGLFGGGEKTMRRVVAISLPAEEMFAKLDMQLSLFENLDLFTLAMDGERLLKGEWVFDFASRQSPLERIRWLDRIGRQYGNRGATSFMTAGLLVFLGQPILRYDHARYLEIMHAQTRVSAIQYRPKDDTEGDEMLGRIPSYYVITKMLVPNRVNRIRYISLTAQATVARAGLAVLRHHLQHGRFPETLAATGQTFTDPFSGKELVYRHDDAGFVVYSIGPNRVDDGGQEKPVYSNDIESSGDIAWRWNK